MKNRQSSKKDKKKTKNKPNIKVIIYSVTALGFLALTFLIDWLFIIGAVVMVWLNQRELTKKR